MKCYRHEYIFFENGLFDAILDMVYVITMEDNIERQKLFYEQLKRIPLLKTINIVYNKGFKKCAKEICNKNKCKNITISIEDLMHINKYILSDSLENKYKHILVLEDDFIFSDSIKDLDVLLNIKKIQNQYHNKELILRLGCIPFISIKTNNTFTRKAFLCLGAHAVIYNNMAIQKINNKIYNTDVDLNLIVTFSGNLYYYIPLVYQLFPSTQNRANWGLNISKIGNIYITYVFDFMIKYLELDKQEEPAYFFMYHNHNYIFAIFLIIHIFVLYVFICILRLFSR